MNVPVLLLIFNRPNFTRQVMEKIRLAGPTKLYVASDGPRHSVPSDSELVRRSRNVVGETQLECDVKKRYLDENLGCKNAISSAIEWFFDNEERGIILEDDCLPSPDFFYFCERLLEYYAEDRRVSAITGSNYQLGLARGTGGYYFSKYNHCWGWATWRNRWKGVFDASMEGYEEWKKSDKWHELFLHRAEERHWSWVFDRVRRQEIDSWAYPWTASVWRAGGLTAVPNRNLITNIGFGEGATHTRRSDHQLASMPTGSLGALAHPIKIEADELADAKTFDVCYEGAYWRFPRLLWRGPKRAIGLKLRKYGLLG